MATSPSMTEELSCSICLDLFDEPVLLPCAHTFCRNCLKQYCAGPAATEKWKLLHCPKCRLQVQLDDDGIEGLPKNTTLANIILSLEEGQKQKSILCDVCDSNPPRDGFRSCSDCTLTFCFTCFSQLHPLRGAFMHHVITSPTLVECKRLPGDRPDSKTLNPASEKRISESSLPRVRSPSPLPKEQAYIEKIRQKMNNKRRELRNTLKDAQDFLRTSEDEFEDQIKQIKSLCSKLHEGIAQREGTLLADCTHRRHEMVTSCYKVISDAQAQTVEMELLDEKFGQLLMKGPVMDNCQELSCLEERITLLSSTSLDSCLVDVPRPRQLQTLSIKHVLKGLDFKQETEVAVPVITNILLRPVTKGPAVIDIKWRESKPGLSYRITAFRKTQKGCTEWVTVDEVTGGNQLMLLPGIDAQYHLFVSIMDKSKGEDIEEDGEFLLADNIRSEERVFRTLPYINCILLQFDPVYCHKAVAVTSSREEVMHRRCKLADLHGTYAPSPCRRLDELEGAIADRPFPHLPHMYWESLIHFHIISRLDDSKLVCDMGLCKIGMEDSCGLVCDNPKSYCCYLVKRNRFITLEFWNGPSQEILAKSINVADLHKENEKTLRLGFYLDLNKRVFAIINPSANTILANFNVKFGSVIWLCGLYCPEQVYATVKLTNVANIPTIVAKLLA